MRVLLDTHTLLWWLDGDRRLSRRDRDPFDRVLIAQAQDEGLALVSNDVFDAYGVRRLW